MVKQEAHLDDLFHALGDPTRRAILRRLSTRPATVGELAEPFDMSLPAVSKHVRLLEAAGLLNREVDGRRHVISLAPDGLETASAWLDELRAFWEDRLDALEAMLAEDAGPIEESKS